MKKILYALFTALLLISCSQITDMQQQLDDHEQRISELETLCRRMNTNIEAIQTLVTAINSHDQIESISYIYEGSEMVGYNVTLTSGRVLVIYSGRSEDGQNGEDGKDGQDGKDGYTPVIGVKMDTDGIYYWTVDGQWLLDENGNKVRAQAIDGEDGTQGEPGNPGDPGIQGEPGVTPKLKIEDGSWYVSYDEGVTWALLGVVTEDEDSSDVDPLFTSVTTDDENAYFVLSDGTTLTLPLATVLDVTFENENLKVSANAELSIAYKVQTKAKSVDIEVVSSSDIKAKVVADDDTFLSGAINIKVGEKVDEYSKVVVFVTDGKNVVMKRITFEQEDVTVEDNDVKEVSSDGGIVELEFMSATELSVEIPESAQSWITIVPDTKSLKSYTVTLNVEPNDTDQPRSAEVTITNEDGSINVTYKIEQDAATTEGDGEGDGEGEQEDPVFELSEQSASIGAEGGNVSVTVTSNIEYEYKVNVDWVSEVVTKASSEYNHTFEVKPNTEAQSRSATITFCAGDNCVPFVITQEAAQVEDEEDDQDAWVTAEFVHKSLVFRFTADWCGFCPMMAAAIADAQEELPGKLEVISVHEHSSSLASEASGKLDEYYQISSYPTGLVDCRTRVANSVDISYTASKIVAAVNDTEETYDTFTGTSWTSECAEGVVTLNLKAYIKKSGSYKVTALLLEDKIISYQADGEVLVESYEHNDIIRAALSDALGESFTVSENAQIKDFTYSVTLPEICNEENVRIVVYIEKLDETLNTYYVDNVDSAALGAEKALAIDSDISGGDTEGITPGDDIIL